MPKPVPKAVGDWIDDHLQRFLKLPYLVLSTVGLVLCGYAVGKTQGIAMVLWILGGALCAALASIIAFARDRKTDREKRHAAEAAEEEKRKAALKAEDSEAIAARLLTTLTSAGMPLVKTVGDICGRDGNHRHDLRTALITQVLEATRRRVGTDSSENRAVFYERLDQDTLDCDLKWVGRDQAPRHQQWCRDDADGHAILAFLDADGDPVRTDKDASQGAGSHRPATYSTFMAVRVTAGLRRFGILCVDSPQASNFTGRDRNPLILLGGLLGAGLAASEKPVVVPKEEADTHARQSLGHAQ